MDNGPFDYKVFIAEPFLTFVTICVLFLSFPVSLLRLLFELKFWGLVSAKIVF